MRPALAIVCLLAGCNASVSGGGAASEGTDASFDDLTDAAVADAPGACPNGRDIYLSFEGEPLTKPPGNSPSDATQNRVRWMGVASVNLPGYRVGDPDRATKIATITQRIQTALAEFPMEVVTTRPAAGPYVMIVFGGNRDQLDTPYSYAVNDFDCGDPVKSDVAWVSDVVPFEKVDDYAIGAVLFGLGLGGTNDPNDCMCGWANGCDQPETTQCTLSSSITANPVCSGAPNPQDEVGAFETAFCN